MSTVFEWPPFSAATPTSPTPLISVDAQDRPFIGFDDSQDEEVQVECRAPSNLEVSDDQSIELTAYMDTATTGNVAFEASVEAITPGDALDPGSASSFATAQSSGAVAVPTGGTYFFTITITLTVAQFDNVAAGDGVRVRINRDVGVASNAAGDCRVTNIEWRDAA